MNHKTWKNIALIIATVLIVGAIAVFIYANWPKIVDAVLEFIYGNVAPDLDDSKKFFISGLVGK